MSSGPTSVRFPADLRQQVAERAAAERRTFSNLVVFLVEDGLAARTALTEREMIAQFRNALDATPEGT
jgi:hypothetical protein